MWTNNNPTFVRKLSYRLSHYLSLFLCTTFALCWACGRFISSSFGNFRHSFPGQRTASASFSACVHQYLTSKKLYISLIGSVTAGNFMGCPWRFATTAVRFSIAFACGGRSFSSWWRFCTGGSRWSVVVTSGGSVRWLTASPLVKRRDKGWSSRWRRGGSFRPFFSGGGLRAGFFTSSWCCWFCRTPASLQNRSKQGLFAREVTARNQLPQSDFLGNGGGGKGEIQ